MKLLITAGATREPLDAVRFLSNVSTGKTGAAIAEAFTAGGHDVTLLHGEGAVTTRAVRHREPFSSAQDLLGRLQRHLATGNFDAVVMTAAVADYRPAEVKSGKISSDADELTIRLVRNEKILPRLKTFSPRALKVIGFKLTVSADEDARRAAVAAQFAAGGVDAVVQNDLTEIRAQPGERHPFWLYRTPDARPENFLGAAALASELQLLIGKTV